MIKIVFGWRDHPDKSAEACEQHYRDVHMGLARKAFDGAEGFRALVYNRVNAHFVNDYNRRDSRTCTPDMDAFVELFFDDRESLEQAFARPIMQSLYDDHENFMDVDSPANIRAYDVDETVFAGRRPQDR